MLAQEQFSQGIDIPVEIKPTTNWTGTRHLSTSFEK